MRFLILIIDVIGIIDSMDCIDSVDNIDIVNYEKSLENGKVHETLNTL